MRVESLLGVLAVLGIQALVVAQAGPIVIWGVTDPYLLNVPSGNFIAATGGGMYGAAIREDGTLAVWGEPGQPTLFNIPSGTFRAVDGGTLYSVGIRTDGTLAAWGDPSFGLTNPPSGTFTKVSASEHHAVALRTDGTLVTWGTGPTITTTPSGQFIDVAAGRENFCVALRTDGTVVAWGENAFGQLNVPSGQFVAVAAGLSFGAALRADGTVTTWGLGGGAPSLLTGSIQRIVGDYGAITGIRADGTLAYSNQFWPPPPGTYSAIGAGNWWGMAVVPVPATSVSLVVRVALLTRRRRVQACERAKRIAVRL